MELPIIVSAAPPAGASEVGVTVRPQVFFSKPVDPATLNSTNFAGQKLPATIVPKVVQNVDERGTRPVDGVAPGGLSGAEVRRAMRTPRATAPH